MADMVDCEISFGWNMASRAYLTSVVLFVITQVGCFRVPDPNSASLTEEERVVASYLQAFDHKDLKGMMACLDVDAQEIDWDLVFDRRSIETYYCKWFSQGRKVKVRWARIAAKEGSVRAWVEQQMGNYPTDGWITFQVRNGKIHQIVRED